MKVRTVTVDFWGTLILDSPAGDERYEGRRLSGFAAVFKKHDLQFSAAQLSSRSFEQARSDSTSRRNAVSSAHARATNCNRSAVSSKSSAAPSTSLT